MKGFSRILAKELKEILRTYKLYVVPGLFLLFGFISPILTKLLPNILGSVVGDIGVVLPEQSWVDSYAQFFKNLNQLGLLAVVLASMGSIVDERSRGVAQLVLTKPVSRTGFVLAKYVAALILVALSTILAFAAAWFYTDILFPGAQFWAGCLATGVYLVYMAVILALVILASVIAKSAVAAGGLTVIGLIVIQILPLLSENLNKYSPGALSGYLYRISGGGPIEPGIGGAIAFATVSVVLLLTAASWVFARQEL